MAEAPLAPLAEGAEVAFANVPHGGPYRVVVELKAGASKDARALYFGESDPFTLRPGKHVAVAVALSLTASPTLADDAGSSGPLSVTEQNEHGLSASRS